MNKKPSLKLWLYFTGVILISVVIAYMIVACVWQLLFELDFIQVDLRTKNIPIIVPCGSFLLGIIITAFVGRRIIRPIQNISDAFDALSKGDFSVKVPEDEKIEEIRKISQRFNAMTYDLAHIETLRTDFVANVSHEIKTPISSIEGYATLLQDHNLTAEKHDRYVEKIIENSRRLSSLSSSMLMLSKLENQETVLNQTEFRLDEQLRKVILMLEPKWSAKNIEFDLNLAKQLYFGNEQLLDQVWTNIIDNAVKHSYDGGVIRISMQQKENQLVVEISDFGEGMTEDVQKHIFEKFYQGDPSRKSEGNGLGLALVKRIIDLCRGSVSVSSTLGNSTTFTVTLPL